MGMTPKTVTRPDGQRVSRSEKILIPTIGREVDCTPYDNHFLYWNTAVGESALMCTCGSVAVVANVNAGDYTRQGLLIVCLVHATYGHHTTGDGKLWM